MAGLLPATAGPRQWDSQSRKHPSREQQSITGATDCHGSDTRRQRGPMGCSSRGGTWLGFFASSLQALEGLCFRAAGLPLWKYSACCSLLLFVVACC
jgi:hypothetical protein